MVDKDSLDRRTVLNAVAAAGAAGLAGCSGNTGGQDGGTGNGTGNGTGSSGDSGDFLQQARQIGFSDNWRQRRMASFDTWPMDARTQVPSGDAQSNPDSWKSSESLAQAPWQPPDGWDETAAGDVEELQILNFGSLDFDPATAATHALFEDRTGISLNPLELVVDQAIPRENAFLQAGRGKPEMFSVVLSDSLSTFAQAGYIQPINPLMSNDEMWEPIQPVAQNTFIYQDELYTGPNTLEGSLIHTRPDLLEEQGVDESVRQRIQEGEWSWDDLETVMKAFEGTGTYAWAYRGSSRVYTLRDWLKMFYQAGGQLQNENGKVKVNTPAGYTSLRKMVEWRDKGWVPEAVVNFGQGDLADGFLSGQFAMVPMYTDMARQALTEYEAETEYRPALSPKGGSDAPNPTRSGIASPNGVAVNPFAPTAQKLAAMLYLDARFSHPASWWEYVVEGNLPYVTKVLGEANETDAAPYPGIIKRQLKLNKIEIFPQERAIKQEISQQVQRTIAGDTSPQKALDSAQEFINTVLNQ